MMLPHSSFSRRYRGVVLAGVLAAVCSVAGAAERLLRIEAPSVVRPNTELSVNVTASTDGADNERVGFLHVEASTDGGKTWLALCYLTNGSKSERQRVGFPVGADGSQVKIRARAAFRGDKGDVDFRGGPIKWDSSWEQWAEPPSRHATVAVKSR